MHKNQENVAIVKVKSSLASQRKYLIFGGIAVLTLIVIAIVLSTLMIAKPNFNDHNLKKIKNPDTRLDCLPWLKNAHLDHIEIECKNISYCKYQPVLNDSNIPACFYDSDVIMLDLISIENTKLGVEALITGNIIRDVLKIEFEYLDNNVLRFRVNLIFSPMIFDYFYLF